MKQHIFEHMGVHLHVEYSPGEQPEFHSVRVLDANYRPTGPDLTHFLHNTLIPCDDEPSMGADMCARSLLSAIVEELP